MVDNIKYCKEPGKPLLIFMACKLTLKQEEMYSLLNSGREQSSGAIADVTLWEKHRNDCGVAERRGKNKVFEVFNRMLKYLIRK